MDESMATLAFSNSVGVGPKSFQKLLRLFSSAKNAWKEAAPNKYKEAGIGKVFYGKFEAFREEFDIKDYALKLSKAKVEFIPFGGKYYPGLLNSLDSPPIGLYIKGNRKLLLEERVIGVVGARKITSYGTQITEDLVRDLCSAGFVIVSGMAMGVDGVAHATAIEDMAPTIAVLGCGVDCPYPRENQQLYEKILDSGGLIVSEYPLGMPASAGTFPARNRIIAGISKAVLVTEAAEDSGSLITAQCARAQGKTVFAVPGPITSQMSRGALKLLKQGAVLVQNAQDIISELGIKNSELRKGKKKEFEDLTKDEKKIVETLENEERTIDEIVRVAEIPISHLSILLSELELRGIIKSSQGKFTLS